jgi:hypothetical protein
MKTETRSWLARLPLWLYLVLRELRESGDAYMCEMILPYLLGCLSIFLPMIVLGVVPEWCDMWYVAAVIGMAGYLLSGVFAFFAYVGRSYGPWQERGAW